MTFPVTHLVTVAGVIFVALLYRLIQLMKHRRFAKLYFEQYKQYMQSKDYKTYMWLCRKLDQIVEEMGFHDYEHSNSVKYLIENLTDEFVSLHTLHPVVYFERYIGLLARRLRQLWHPFGLMMLPVHFLLVDILLGGLKIAKIINKDTYHSFSHHKAIRIMIGIGAVINFLLIPYNFIAGWNDVKHFFSG